MARGSPRITRPYDVTFKHLVEEHPRDALAFVGVTDVRTVEVVDTDTSTISSAVDKALRVETSQGEFLVHLEFQSGPDPELLERAFWYNATLYRRHRLPVQTTLVLLAKGADQPRLTGRLEICLPSGMPCHAFHYRVMRLWRVPVATILAGGVGVLPLAPLGEGAQERINDVVGAIAQRFAAISTIAEQDTLWAATYFFMGLKYDAELIQRLIPGGRHMRESVTYQLVVEEGRQEGRRIGLEEGRQEGRQEGLAQGARKMLLLAGCKRFGKPSRRILTLLDQVSTLDGLERLMIHIDNVNSWYDLFAVASGKNGHKKKRS
jgi:predicted transposase YdaD